MTDFIQNVIGEKTDIIASNESISFVTLACNMNKDLANSIIAINPTSLKELHITTDKYASVKKTLLELPVIGTFLYNIQTTYYHNHVHQTDYATPQIYKKVSASRMKKSNYHLLENRVIPNFPHISTNRE